MKVGPVLGPLQGPGDAERSVPAERVTRYRGKARAGSPALPRAAQTVALADKDGGTLLTYDVEAQIGGKLAQLGQRLINGSAKKLADEFFANFAKAVQG